jgi:hypothetical protein
MKIRIDAKPVGPLSILTELPEARLATLEGLNGIGKTLAVRLLQLCVGQLPYAAKSPAFGSLCDGLGAFRVTVSGLSGGTKIVWEGDSRDWIESVVETGLPSFRRVLVNDREASLDEVRAQLSVSRLAGDEGIVETLARDAEGKADLLDRAARRIADRESGPLSTLERTVAAAISLLGDWTQERYRLLLKTVADAETELSQDELVSKSASERLERLKAADGLARQLKDYQERAPDLEHQLQDVDQRISEIRGAREATEKQISNVAARIGASETAQKELRLAGRTLERNRDNLTIAISRMATSAAALRIQPDAATIQSFTVRLLEQIAQLRATQRELDAAPAMVVLLDDLIIRLTAAERQGLGSQVALEDEEIRVRLSVAQTSAAMGTRKTQLIGQPPPPQAREVAQKLSSASRTLDLAKRAAEEAVEVEKYERLVRQSEDRLERVLRVADPKSDAELRRLQEQRRKYDDELFALASRRASLREQLGPTGDEAGQANLERQLNDLLSSVKVDQGSLEQSLVAAAEDADGARVRFVATRDRTANLKRDIARATGEIQRATIAVHEDPSHEWLRVGLAGLGRPSAEAATEEQIAALDVIRHALEALLERLGRHRVQLIAVAEALRGAGRHLRGLERGAQEYVREVETYLEGTFSDWFNNEHVKRELLPGATGPVHVDIEARQVSWPEGSLRRSRPLEAFSSGEQAFAYTRARLAVLDEQPSPPNRLIVLDEFGAFIAHDWLASLLSYLRERAADHAGDQVLVILPLSQDYGQLAKAAIGADAKLFESLADQVKSRRYAVQIQTG